VHVFRQYLDAGVSKFVAIPLSAGPQDLQRQMLHLTEEICPAIED
jgi:hypothetical protein